MSRERGFSLIASIFLLTAVAALAVFVGNLRVVQQTTVAYSLRGAAALQAARSGMEWGIHQALNAAACPPATTFSPTDPVLSAFSISVNCTESAHMEGATAVEVYRITAVASAGTYGTLDFVQRQLQATVSIDPP